MINLLRFNTAIFILLVCLIFLVLLFELHFLTKEDGIIEYLSAIFWGIGLLLCTFLLRIKQTNRLVIFTFLFVCFIALGEEISWGQRIFNIKTPEYIARHNAQSELNFHNLKILQKPGGAWRHFFKTGEFNYQQITDVANLFRIGFFTFFFIFPLIIKLNYGAKILLKFGYHPPKNYFSLFVFIFIATTLVLANTMPDEYSHTIQEIREMSYALFVAMYLINHYLFERSNAK